MRIGISLTSAHRTTDPREGAQRMIQRARAAREADLDSLFVGDHHSTPYPYYQNVPMMGRLLVEWNDRPAGCLFLLPLWNPVLVAEQVGTLAAIAQGRFIFQCGLGDDQQQSAAMGANIKLRPSAFEESFDAVKRLLAGETVSSSGRFNFSDASVSPRPSEPVEYWIGSSAKPAIDRAARLGDGWIASPSLTLHEAIGQREYYIERCTAYARQPSAIAIRRDIYIAESQADADETADAVMKKGYRGFRREALTIETIQGAIEAFRQFETAGYTDIIVRHVTLDQSRVIASTHRLAEVRSALG